MKRIPKSKAAWKRLQPTSVEQALKYCQMYAWEVKRLTVDGIAELMAVSPSCLYKWCSGSMPVDRIPAFEHICGIDFVSQYLAIRSHKVVIDIPVGRQASQLDISSLQQISAEAMSELIKFYQNGEDLEKTIALLTSLIKGAAYHRENIQTQPELDLAGDSND